MDFRPILPVDHKISCAIQYARVKKETDSNSQSEISRQVFLANQTIFYQYAELEPRDFVKGYLPQRYDASK